MSAQRRLRSPNWAAPSARLPRSRAHTRLPRLKCHSVAAGFASRRPASFQTMPALPSISGIRGVLRGFRHTELPWRCACIRRNTRRHPSPPCRVWAKSHYPCGNRHKVAVKRSFRRNTSSRFCRPLLERDTALFEKSSECSCVL